MKIDEYVPTMIPMIMTNENPRSTSPPRKKRTTTTTKVSSDVRTVRDSVWLMEWFTSSASGARRFFSRFSRIRSKTTTVSLTE